MAEACDGLVLTGLPYFYAGATASGRGTVQVSVREGIDYLMGGGKQPVAPGIQTPDLHQFSRPGTYDMQSDGAGFL